uniref:Uncharacterized protein n=1 Tax=Salix viminalis TaxID=40686 RepID=A0A6N2L397_SALVM
MPVWVRLYGLPFPLWSTEGLSKAASMVGRPLSCDEATFHGTRLDYARMCVEVTAGDEFVHHFELEMPSSTSPCMVRVDYKWKPTRCQQCKTFGHSCLNQEHRMEQDLIPNPTILGGAENPTNHILPKTDKSKQQPSQSKPITQNGQPDPGINKESLATPAPNQRKKPHNQTHIPEAEPAPKQLQTKPITDTGSSQAGMTTTTAGHKAREEATRSDEGGQTVGKIAANPIVQSIDSSQSERSS